MKRCQKCNVEYLDNTLEFCLEDGNRLIQLPDENISNAKTEVLNKFIDNTPVNLDNLNETNFQNKDTNKLTNIKEKITYQGYRVIEIAQIVLALTHNYWQWLFKVTDHFK